MSSKQVLDPVSTMCRMITLNFRPKFTKICVSNNTITIQQPSTFQWASRKIHGDDRDDISSLYAVIVRIIEWYINPLYDIKFKNKRTKIPNTIKPIEESQKKSKSKEATYFKVNKQDVKTDSKTDAKVEKTEIKADIKLEQKMEQKLEQKTDPKLEQKDSQKSIVMTNDEISQTEDYYINLDETEVEPYWDCLTKLCKYMIIGLSKLQETYEAGNVVYTLQYYINLMKDALDGRYTRDKLPKINMISENKNPLDYNKIKDLWNYKRIKEVCELYDKCFETMCDVKEKNEVNRSVKVEGYLNAVEHLLQVSDVTFKQIIG